MVRSPPKSLRLLARCFHRCDRFRDDGAALPGHCRLRAAAAGDGRSVLLVAVGEKLVAGMGKS